MARKNSRPSSPEAPQEEPSPKPKSKRTAAAQADSAAATKATHTRKKADPAPLAELVAEPQPSTAKPTRAARGKKTASEAAPPVSETAALAAQLDSKSKGRSKKSPHRDETELVQSEAPAERTPRRGRRKATEDTAAALPEFPEEVTFRKPQRQGGQRPQARSQERPAPQRQRTKAKEATPFVMPPGDDLPVPIWRSRQDATPGKTPAEPAEDKVGGRRSRRGRRKELQEVEISAAAALEPTFRAKRGSPKTQTVQAQPAAPEAPPQPPPKPIIPIPENAPQVIVRNGVPSIVRNKRVYPPISFFASAPDERRSRNVFDEIRLASENGIHLHVHLIELEVSAAGVQSSVAFAGYMLRKTIEVDPDAQVLFRIVFVAPSGWTDRFPNAVFVEENGRIAEPSLCDDAFWGEARACLQDFVKRMQLLDEREHIMGLHLERGEWFFAEGAGYDSSKAATQKFRDWARTRYINDIVALRAAWFDGSAEFDALQIPEHTRPDEGEKFVRSSRKERRWVDYHLFLSDSTVARIGDLAYAVKEASEGWFLAGVSYGYTFEWSHPSSGHLSLGKLLRTPEIDFIAGPPSYRSREPGGAAPFPSPIDSYPLNGKIYISEEDFKTAIGEWKEPDDFNPVIRTPQALESVHWRGIGAALAHASGVCWMDLWGNGWLKTSTIWKRGGAAREALIHRLATPISDPDVAVFIDERSLAYLVDQQSFAVLVQNVRESVLRAGVSAGFYLLSDLTHREHFPESKVYVFLNAWDLRPDLRAAIKNRLQRNGKLLFWLYGAGMFESGRESLERAREVMGVALKPQPFHSKSGTTVLNRRHPLCEAFPDKGIIGGAKLGTSYFAIPEEAMVLGEYSQTGLPSFVVREFHPEDPELRWKSVFMGEPVVTPALVRALCLQAGAHVWNYQDDVVHVRPPFLTVHCSGSGPRAITLPEKWSAYSLTSQEWVANESSSLRFNGLDGTTHVFLVGRQADVEQMVSLDPEDALRIEEIPGRAENTVRFDAFSFDVPIMKLGEWMEGGTLDDVSEDWLLHPKVSDFENTDDEPAEEEGRVGSRRRRRGRKPNGQRPPRGQVATIEADGDLAMNIVFRKRE